MPSKLVPNSSMEDGSGAALAGSTLKVAENGASLAALKQLSVAYPIERNREDTAEGAHFLVG